MPSPRPMDQPPENSAALAWASRFPLASSSSWADVPGRTGVSPERAGAAVNVLAYVPLADLMVIEGSSALLAQWTAGLRAA